ncbi:hypothetical protein N9S14_02065 [Candidatus Pelagibacter sp.]|nr:hypothetical protein [Candidatus Pelagibacter sp.]|tara:strand:- start:23 stop:478 length:456 start_codon:yes stop_codon:yes gene_type:complete
MKKILISTLLFFILANCGFSPIYSKSNNQKVDINIQSVEGDRLINNRIVSELNRIDDNLSENKFNININTLYNKSISSKDATGATSNYQLDVISEITIGSKDSIEKINITEKFIMDKNDNTIDERNYERTIKKTFASLIVKQVLTKLYSKK